MCCWSSIYALLMFDGDRDGKERGECGPIAGSALTSEYKFIGLDEVDNLSSYAGHEISGHSSATILKNSILVLYRRSFPTKTGSIVQTSFHLREFVQNGHRLD